MFAVDRLYLRTELTPQAFAERFNSLLGINLSPITPPVEHGPLMTSWLGFELELWDLEHWAERFDRPEPDSFNLIITFLYRPGRMFPPTFEHGPVVVRYLADLLLAHQFDVYLAQGHDTDP